MSRVSFPKTSGNFSIKYRRILENESIDLAEIVVSIKNRDYSTSTIDTS